MYKGVVFMEKKNTADKIKLIFLLLYFLILTVERVISLVSVFTGNFAEYNGLDWYMTALTILAIFGSYCFIITKCRFTVKHYENGKTSACPVPDDSTFGKLPRNAERRFFCFNLLSVIKCSNAIFIIFQTR